MTPLLLVCAALTACLAAYAAGHYFCAGVFLFSVPRPRAFEAHPVDPVAVLVPARNEGERALRVIASLLAQDHAGPIEIILLVKDADDGSMPCLRARYPEADFRGPRVWLSRDPRRAVSVLFAGIDGKSEKVNAAIREIDTPWVAILDCDHQAHPSWIRSSIALLHEQGAKVIQGRRAPISAHGFCQLWDSLHQHIGCELFNVAFTRLGLTVFFTGTTAVVETRLLRERPLGVCLTEDADFSYAMLMKGVRVINNPYFGSDEETSPDLYSFLARRRRWANGHTEAFFRHLRELPASPLLVAERVQFLFHGAHYLVSLVVFALHLVIGLVFVQSLSWTSIAAAGLASGILAGMVAGTQRTLDRTTWLSELVVLFGWLGPAVVIAMNFVQAALMHDFTRAALQIPGPLQALGIVGLCAPVVVLLVGLVGFRQLGLGSLLVVVVSWPFAFYLDLSGVLLGMADHVTGRGSWRPVARGEPAAVNDATSPLPVLGIRDSWRLGPIAASARGLFTLRSTR